MSIEREKALADIVMSCAYAIIAGQPTVTISATGKHPVGFPRGKLLSVGTNGAHNYAVNPVMVLAWVHERRMTAAPTAGRTET